MISRCQHESTCKNKTLKPSKVFLRLKVHEDSDFNVKKVLLLSSELDLAFFLQKKKKKKTFSLRVRVGKLHLTFLRSITF